MKTIYLEPKDLFPGIILDKESDKFKIYGISCPPNAFEFYDPLFKWFDAYFLDPLENTTLDLELDYFNTSTAKFLYMIMTKLEKLSDIGHKVKVRWYYSKYDEDMLEEGEEFENIVDIPFEIIPIENETNDSEEDEDNDYFDNIIDDTF